MATQTICIAPLAGATVGVVAKVHLDLPCNADDDAPIILWDILKCQQHRNWRIFFVVRGRQLRLLFITRVLFRNIANGRCDLFVFERLSPSRLIQGARQKLGERGALQTKKALVVQVVSVVGISGMSLANKSLANAKRTK